MKARLQLLLVCLVLLAFWEWMPQDSGAITHPMTPSSIWLYLLSNWEYVLLSTAYSLGFALLGLLVAAIVSFTLLLPYLYFGRIREMMDVVVIISQTIPIIALVPLFIAGFGFGGPTLVLITALVAFFPVYMSLISAYRSAPPDMLDLLAVYKVRRRYRVMRVFVPWCLPGLLSGLRIGATLAIVGIIIAEISAGTQYGWGKMIVSGIRTLSMEKSMTAIVLASFFGYLLYLAFNSWEKHLQRWLWGTGSV